MKWRCDHRRCDCDLSNRNLSPKNVFGASTGFERVASALTLSCSNKWTMKTHTLGAGQFIEFILPVKGMKQLSFFTLKPSHKTKSLKPKLLHIKTNLSIRQKLSLKYTSSWKFWKLLLEAKPSSLTQFLIGVITQEIERSRMFSCNLVTNEWLPFLDQSC